MADYHIQIPVSMGQSDSSVDSSLSSPTDSSEQEASTLAIAPSRPTKRHSTRGRKRLQGECQRSYPIEDEEDKKRKRAKKERTRVSNLAVAYQTLARTIGLYPLRGAQKRITHEQILQGANKLITELQQELDCIRKTDGKVVVVNGSNTPVYTPSRHYTISSSGEVLVVEETENVTEPINQLGHLDLSCDETLPLPTLDESDDSSDIPLSMSSSTQALTTPLLNYELVSPSNPSSVSETHIQQLLGGFNGESLVSSTTMGGYSTIRQGFLLSPTFMSHVPATSSSYQACVSPIDVGAYEEIVNEELNNTPIIKGSIAAQ